MSYFQGAVARTMNHKLTFKEAIANYALGIAGEAGEVIEPIKKHLFHEKSLDVNELTEELADVCWYVAALANELGIDMDEALSQNVEKLMRRHPDGFGSMGQ